MINKQIIPILLCGGSGSRLWPMSRESFPKQYLKCNPNSKYTFLQETQIRLKKIKNIQSPILICNSEHRFVVAEQMRAINVKPNSIILETQGKNTAPAIAIASIKALEIEDDPIILVLPADHSIENIDMFVKVIEKGIEYADKEQIITFGIPPYSPESGYGYIQAEMDININEFKTTKIKKFIEKPNKEIAKKLIKNSHYLWNSGIFLLKAKLALKEIKNLSPKIYKTCQVAIKKSIIDLEFLRLNEEAFNKCPNQSFDIAIMEKTNKGFVIPLNVGWSDIGSWRSMWEVSKKDNNGNFVSGEIITKNVANSYLRSEDRLIVGIGLKDIVIIETVDAILVANISETQCVKDIVKTLEIKGKSEANIHKKIYRPWGNYTSIAKGENWQVKKITVSSKQSLSLQMHNHRTEHWVVVHGTALVEINGEKKILNRNESTFIPKDSRHRLSNPGDSLLVMIEVQSGNYLGEDDIIRFDDIYGRN